MIKPTMSAPNFTTDALYMGNRVNITLSDYVNDWVVLFFYPSDFTFV